MIEMFIHSIVTKAETDNLEVRDINQEFKFNIDFSKVDSEVLLEIVIPNNRDTENAFYHITLNDNDIQKELPVHIAIGV